MRRACLAGLAVILAAGCGGGDDDARPRRDPIVAAVDRMRHEGGGVRLALRARVVGESGVATYAGETVIDLEGDRWRSRSGPFQQITDVAQDFVYVRAPGYRERLPAASRWVRFSAADVPAAEDELREMGVMVERTDPLTVLRTARGTSEGRREGTLTRYETTIDTAGGRIAATCWLDDRGQISRARYAYRDYTGKMRVTETGDGITVELPSPLRVVEWTELPVSAR